jgi:hypothetical protein
MKKVSSVVSCLDSVLALSSIGWSEFIASFYFIYRRTMYSSNHILFRA